MRTYILPTRDMAARLAQSSETFCKKNKVESMSEEGAQEYVVGLVEDIVNQRSRWIKNGGWRYSEAALFKALPWWEPVSNEQLRDDFYDHYLSEVVDLVYEQLEQFIPDQTWTVWYVRMLGGDIALEQGPDYRILDWERRIANGEWNFDD